MRADELIGLWRALADAADQKTKDEIDDLGVELTSDEIKAEIDHGLVPDILRECAQQLEDALTPIHHDVTKGPFYHTFHVAIVVGPEATREEAERSLHNMLPRPDDPRGDLGPGGWVDCWWIAEDTRYDRSDNDAAVFVPNNLTQVEARGALVEISEMQKRLEEGPPS